MLLILFCGVNNATWGDTWDGTTKTAPDMSTNKGTSEALAIQITNAAELAWLGDQMRLGNTANGKTYGNKYWKLMADIDLGGNSTFTGRDWASMIGHTGSAFCGYFNGNSKTISNIQVAAVTSTKYYGLFPSIQGKSTTDLSTVHDLNISGVFIKSNVSCANYTRIGGLAGYVKQANISNVAVSNVNFTYTDKAPTTNTTQLGGAIGCIENNTTLNNVDVTGVTASFANTTTKLYLGGLVGQSGGTQNTNSITNCDVKSIQIAHSSNITGETQFGGLVGQANTSLSTISNNTVEGQESVNGGKGFDVSITGTTASLSVGGLLGHATGNASSTISVSGCHAYEFHISHTGAVSSANIGGLIGNMSNYVTVTSSNAKSVNATFGNTTTSLYLGGLVGQSSGGTANTNSVTGNTVNTVKVTHNNNVTGTTYMGGLVGNAQANLNVINNNTVAGVEGKNDGKAFDVSVSGTTVNFYAGGLLGYTKGDGHEVKDNRVEKVYITNTGTINGGRLGGFIGYVESDNTTSKILVKGNTASTINIQVDGNTVGTPYLGGFIGQAKGKASPNNRSVIEGNTVTSPTVTMSGEVGHTFYLGGFLGSLDAHANLYNNKVETPNISITNTINAATYVGGAVGYQANYTTIDGMTVTNGSINGPSAVKTVKNNTNFMVGGFIGQQNSSGTVAYQPNIFRNIAVTGININLEKYQPAGNISNHKFSVGGIAGCVHSPNKDANGFCGMPENIIFKGGRIYAPYATTSPTVASFNNSNPSHYTLTTEVITNIDALDKAKTKTWYYSDYELGLSPGLLKSSVVVAKGTTPSAKDQFRLNCTATLNSETVQYITVNGSTFQNQNRFQDSERDSKTVLWWTTTAAVNATKVEQFTKEEQPIYPYQAGATATTYPYYWYFFQGVMNANYVSSDVATKIIEGIAGNKTEAAKEHPITLYINNNKADERGFDQRTISVVAKTTDNDGNVVDATTGITGYQWYVNGVANGIGTSINLTPHWKDGQGITVNALNGATVVATSTYTLAPGVLKTKNNEPIRSDINGRGTKDNPYIIDCESALRLWSYLSTANTYTVWEGIVKPVSPFPANQVAGHYNRAYYELGADITMGADPFIPISHVGYGGDATWGTYNTSWIFQGVFDGKGHKISGLKITWGAGQYNGNNTNIYYGLFGAVGNTAGTAAAVVKWGESAASNTVIKNLVIDGATLTHDDKNTTFSYRKDYSYITSDNGNNCMVGVLAGVVGGYTTVQNIEIRDSKITDESTSNDYSLAKMGLYVGGAIGSVQCAFNQTGNVPTGTNIRHIAAQVNITLTHPAFADATAKAQVGLFNVGGIVGRYMATSATQAQMQAVMPKYTIYSGTVNAPNAWISPVIAATRFTGQNGGEYKHFSKQWEGNNADAASQIKTTNAQYYNFNIYYDGGSKAIDESYPANTCKLGFRPITPHADGQDETSSTYTASKYQGVNYAARYVAENSTLELLNKERTEGYSFVWEGGVVKMTTEDYVGISLSREADTNKFTAVMEGVDPAPDTYKWEVSFDNKTWHTIDGVTSDTYTVPVSLKTKYVRATATVNTTDYITLEDVVEADKELCNPAIIKGGTDDNPVFSFALNQKETTPAPELTVSYEWYKTSTVSSDLSNKNLELTKSTLTTDYNNVVFCKAIVKEYGIQVADYFIVNGATVIYVNGNNYTGTDEYGKAIGEGNDTNDGLTPQTPVKTIDVANGKLKSEANGGTVDNNIIVIMGKLNDENVYFHSSGTNPATLTGKHNGFDYHGVITIRQKFPSGGEHNVNKIDTDPTDGTNCYVLGDTKFENLMFYGQQEANAFIELHGHDAIFGKGLVMQNFKDLSLEHGNMNNSEVIPEFTIILNATNLSEAKIKEYTKRIHDRGKPQTVTFQSGHYGRLMGGRFTQKFFCGGEAGSANNTAYSILGSAEYPVWAVVNVEIDADNEMTDNYNKTGAKTYSRDVNAIIAGLTDGSMYADYTINFYGGNVAYIVGANQGNPVKNGTATYKPLDGTSNDWGEWPNASFFGRTVINVEQKSGVKDITVGNLYAGGLGRKVQTGSASAAVDMYVYGRTEVNVKNGTVSGSVYGGGVGGVLGVNPWDAHVPYATTAADAPANAIINKVQYGDNQFGGTWSSMTKASPMAKVKLQNLNAEGNGYDKEYLDLRNTSTTVNISGGQVNGNVYGGGFGFVQDMPYEATMQGVGSVFGTANINITGGTISGNIYGGSQGHTYYYNQTNKYGQTLNHIAEMNGTVNINVTGTEEKWPTIRGDIFGAGQGIPSASNELEYERIATTGNADLGNGNEYKSTVNITIDLPNTKAIEGNIFGGGRMGAVDGDINVVINGGQINGNVYGGGKGEKGHIKKARVNGTTNVTVGY